MSSKVLIRKGKSGFFGLILGIFTFQFIPIAIAQDSLTFTTSPGGGPIDLPEEYQVNGVLKAVVFHPLDQFEQREKLPHIVPNWNLGVKVEIEEFDLDENSPTNGAIDVIVTFPDFGVHVNGPHITDTTNNILIDNKDIENFIPLGESRTLTMYGRTTHPARAHRDFYGFTWSPEASTPDFSTGILEGEAKAKAIHAGRGKEQLRASRRVRDFLGIGSVSNSSVSFIPTGIDQGFLRFSIGSVDILDNESALSGSIDPLYENDPVLSASWTVSDIELLGRRPDGSFQFGSGTVTLTDPNGNFSLQGEFPEFTIVDTSAINPVSSFGLFDTLVISDVGDSSDGPSVFLQDFVDRNIFGIDLPEADTIQGIDFGFTTLINLVTLTDNFSQSAIDVPITAFISQNGTPVPESSSTLGLLVLGTLVTASTLKGKLKPSKEKQLEKVS